MDALNLITKIEGMFVFDTNENEIICQQINSPELNPNVLSDIMKEVTSENSLIFPFKNFLVTAYSLLSVGYLVVIGNENANDILLSEFASTLSFFISDKLTKNTLSKLPLLFDEAVVNGFIVESDPDTLYSRISCVFENLKSHPTNFNQGINQLN